MWHRIAAVLPIIGLLCGLGFGVASAADDPTDERIRQFILNNPEVLIQALEKYQLKERDRQRQESAAAIATYRDKILNHPMTPVSGNKNGDVTVVEFFDYQCGFCKRTLPTMLEILKQDKKLRVVWKELPILGPVSQIAARAAMAAQKQGKYLPFHVAVMGARGQLTANKIFRLAKKVGLDVDRLKRDMKDPAIDAYLRETIRLAQSIGINGTPGFIIGDKLVPGAIERDRMMELIANARSRS